jgi:nicotinamide-nucleotide amidase
MNVEIITIGDEILIGQIVDTNSAWMAVELNKAGFEIEQISSVHDREEHIIQALDLALTRADVVLFTGGVGPTRDDITKHTLCKYFDARLVLNENVLRSIEELLRQRQRAMNELTRTQAMVPDKAVIIQNKLGTAPVTWFEKNGKVVVSMPGVPYEMKQLMKDEIIPRLSERFETPTLIHKTIMVQGYPESALALKIADWELSLPPDLRLAYLPDFNLVRLRISAVAVDPEFVNKCVEQKVDELKLLLGEAVITTEDLPLEQLVVDLLRAGNLRLATAESCTGGYLAHRITSVPGSSTCYNGTIVAYDNEVKEKILQVDSMMLAEQGAVSKAVAEEMARNVKRLLNVDVALAATGVAGPGGGTYNKPVGTVWICLATPGKLISREYRFTLGRELNIQRTAQSAMLLLLDYLRGNSSECII